MLADPVPSLFTTSPPAAARWVIRSFVDAKSRRSGVSRDGTISRKRSNKSRFTSFRRSRDLRRAADVTFRNERTVPIGRNDVTQLEYRVCASLGKISRDNYFGDNTPVPTHTQTNDSILRCSASAVTNHAVRMFGLFTKCVGFKMYY